MSQPRPPGADPPGGDPPDPAAPGPGPAPAEAPRPAAAAAVPFWTGVPGWLGVLGRLRDVVRQEVLAAQLSGLPQLAGRPARVLDVGCGQGTQALRAARAGHEVTGVDSSRELLDLFGQTLAAEPAAVAGRVRLVHGAGEQVPELVTGRFDLVMCHGVLMYLDDIRPMLSGLARVAAPDGAISLLVRNGLAPAMRAGLRGRWPEALRAFDSRDYVNRLGLAAHAHAPRTWTARWPPWAGGVPRGSGCGCSLTTGTSPSRRPGNSRSCSRPRARRAAVTRTGAWRRCCT